MPPKIIQEKSQEDTFFSFPFNSASAQLTAHEEGSKDKSYASLVWNSSLPVKEPSSRTGNQDEEKQPSLFWRRLQALTCNDNNHFSHCSSSTSWGHTERVESLPNPCFKWPSLPRVTVAPLLWKLTTLSSIPPIYTFLILPVQTDRITTKAVQPWANKFSFLGPVSSSEKMKVDFPNHQSSNQILRRHECVQWEGLDCKGWRWLWGTGKRLLKHVSVMIWGVLPIVCLFLVSGFKAVSAMQSPSKG